MIIFRMKVNIILLLFNSIPNSLHQPTLGVGVQQFTQFTQFKCDNIPVCAVSPPSKSFSVVSKAQCVLYCQKHRQQPESCDGVNYKEQSETCEVFNYEGNQFVKNSAGCQYIQKIPSEVLNCKDVPFQRDCNDVWYLTGTTQSVSGVYTVFVGNDRRRQRPLSVYCEMTTTGGWTVVQRRRDGSVDFYCNWMKYAAGFGDPNGELWIGLFALNAFNSQKYKATKVSLSCNDNLNLLTSAKRYKLRVDLADFNGNTVYAEYDNFVVNAAADGYRLASVGTYTGTAGDSLSIHVGWQFSTYDNSYAVPRCLATPAISFKGAWWYENCGHYSNLNGHFYEGPHSSNADGVEWYTWTGFYYSLKSVMKIESVN